MHSATRALALCLAFLGLGASATERQQREMNVTVGTPVSGRAQAISSVDALPAHIAAAFREPIAFVQTPSGEYLVLDHRAQAVYGVDRRRDEVTKLVQVGEERGRIIQPTAFASEPGGGSFVVVDQPGGRERIQRFADRGFLLNGFTLPAQPGPHLVLDGVVFGGIGAVQFTGDSIFVSQPQTGSLITEYAWNGRVRRAFGALRATGHESDEAVHLSMNTGIPLVEPAGGFFFVFQSGVPIFRKYDRAGTLVFERHVEGRDLDPLLKSQPTVWPKRQASNGEEWPAVPPIVRTAGVDSHGNLWIAVATGLLYVYSGDGEKIGSFQLRAAGPVSPTSLYFAGSSLLLVTPGCYVFDVSNLLKSR